MRDKFEVTFVYFVPTKSQSTNNDHGLGKEATSCTNQTVLGTNSKFILPKYLLWGLPPISHSKLTVVLRGCIPYLRR